MGASVCQQWVTPGICIYDHSYPDKYQMSVDNLSVTDCSSGILVYAKRHSQIFHNYVGFSITAFI